MCIMYIYVKSLSLDGEQIIDHTPKLPLYHNIRASYKRPSGSILTVRGLAPGKKWNLEMTRTIYMVYICNSSELPQSIYNVYIMYI